MFVVCSYSFLVCILIDHSRWKAGGIFLWDAWCWIEQAWWALLCVCELYGILRGRLRAPGCSCEGRWIDCFLRRLHGLFWIGNHQKRSPRAVPAQHSRVDGKLCIARGEKTKPVTTSSNNNLASFSIVSFSPFAVGKTQTRRTHSNPFLFLFVFFSFSLFFFWCTRLVASILLI